MTPRFFLYVLHAHIDETRIDKVRRALNPSSPTLFNTRKLENLFVRIGARFSVYSKNFIDFFFFFPFWGSLSSANNVGGVCRGQCPPFATTVHIYEISFFYIHYFFFHLYFGMQWGLIYSVFLEFMRTIMR